MKDPLRKKGASTTTTTKARCSGLGRLCVQVPGKIFEQTNHFSTELRPLSLSLSRILIVSLTRFRAHSAASLSLSALQAVCRSEWISERERASSVKVKVSLSLSFSLPRRCAYSCSSCISSLPPPQSLSFAANPRNFFDFDAAAVAAAAAAAVFATSCLRRPCKPLPPTTTTTPMSTSNSFET